MKEETNFIRFPIARIHFSDEEREVCDPHFYVAARVEAKKFTGFHYIYDYGKFPCVVMRSRGAGRA
jgi:hypothetical protein